MYSRNPSYILYERIYNDVEYISLLCFSDVATQQASPHSLFISRAVPVVCPDSLRLSPSSTLTFGMASSHTKFSDGVVDSRPAAASVRRFASQALFVSSLILLLL